jgi:hypothetical protein
MLGPAVTGTTNVLKAASAVNVQRVVVVSSLVAVEISPKDWPEGKIRDESCWSDKEFCRSIEVTCTANFCIRVRTAKICYFFIWKNCKICLVDLLPCVLQSWYPVAKIISEEAALAYGQQTGLDVVTINPGLVSAPCCSRRLTQASSSSSTPSKVNTTLTKASLSICLPVHSKLTVDLNLTRAPPYYYKSFELRCRRPRPGEEQALAHRRCT